MNVSEMIMVLHAHKEVFGDNKVFFVNEEGEEYSNFDVEEFKNAIVFVEKE